MKKVYGIIVKDLLNGVNVVKDAHNENLDITDKFRTSIINVAAHHNQALELDTETGRARRIELNDIPKDVTLSAPTKQQTKKPMDPVLELITTASKIKPTELEISDVKWKYLVRSAVRGKNIMLVGPAGCGKTQAARLLPKATDRPFFYFNLGSTQDARAVLLGNTNFKNNETVFNRSAFIEAIQTENSVILLDELSRAHPDAWNILMTVLDEGQRYLRIDEDVDSPVINVASGVSFIATANIGTEYTSTRVIDRAIMDRFEIIEVDILNKETEISLLSKRYGDVVDSNLIEAVADIADITRTEWRNEDGKLSTMISTRMTVRVCELLADGFTLEEAAEVSIIPFFDASGGADSERTFVKQIIQKHFGTGTDNIFNIPEQDTENSPF